MPRMINNARHTKNLTLPATKINWGKVVMPFCKIFLPAARLINGSPPAGRNPSK